MTPAPPRATTTYLQTLRLFSRDLRLFLVTAVLVGFAWDGVRTVLFNLYLLRLGYGPQMVGLINAASALVFSLSCIPAGALGTRWGSRRMLITGIGLLAAGFALLPLAEFVPGAWRTQWLLGASVLTHLGLALYLVNGLPFTMGATRPEERNHVFSVHIALVPLAAFAGSLIGGALPGVMATVFGVPVEGAAAYGYSLWLAALALVPGALVLLRTRSGDAPQAREPATSVPQVRDSRAPYGLMLMIALIMALRFGGRGTAITFFNVYLDDGLGVSTALIGILVAAGQLLSVPAALAAPLLVARWGSIRTIFWGSLAMAVAMLPLALVPHWPAAGFGFVTSAALFAVTIGPMLLFSQELVTPRWRATMATAYMMGAGLAFAAMSLLGGFAIAALGYRSLFAASTGLMAASALVFWVYFRAPRGELDNGD